MSVSSRNLSKPSDPRSLSSAQNENSPLQAGHSRRVARPVCTLNVIRTQQPKKRNAMERSRVGKVGLSVDGEEKIWPQARGL